MKSRRLTSAVLAALVAVPFAGLEAMVTARAASADPVVSSYTDPSCVPEQTGCNIVTPHGITAGSDGALWFINSNSFDPSIGRVTTAGSFTSYRDPSISGGGGGSDITAGPDGALWFTNYGTNTIGRITTAGSVTNYTDPSILAPRRITAGPDGALWFTNYGTTSTNGSIGRITTAGTVTNYTSPRISFPEGITAGPDGALWFMNSGNRSIGRITTAGSVTGYTDPNLSWGAVGIAAGPDGALWFTNGESSIGRITTAGSITSFTDPSISNPQYITAGPDGALWFTNVNSGQSIGRITIAGSVTNYTDPSISNPAGITAGSDGAVWFANPTNNSIGRITVPTPGAPWTPTGLSVSPASGSGSVSVSWTAPPENAAPIDHYDVSCVSSNGGSPGSASVPASPVTVTGLTSNKTYTCTVTATNSFGTGDGAVSSSFVVATAPGAPTGAKAVSGSTTVATGSLLVTFAAPASNGGSVITSYTATCTSTNGGVTKTGVHSGATAAPITVGAVTTGKTYACTVKATNVVGTGAASAPSLPVIVGSPAAPTNVKAVSGLATTTSGPLTVTFTIGANNGSAITSQTATCVSSNGGVTKTGVHSGATAAPITVAGTSTAKTYTCTVKAINARGAGLASAPSLPVIVGSPAPPTGVTAVKVASGQLRVTFTPGANNGSATTSYTATCTSSNGGVVGSKTGPASPLTVTGLTAGKTYTCTVKGANSRGYGLSSAPSGAVVA